MNDKKRNKKRFSPIPKHLSPEELEKWEKQEEWSRKELKRRKKNGDYPHQSGSSKKKAKLKKRRSKKDNPKTELYYF